MRAVVQRVSKASVLVGDEIVGRIGKGLLVYLGVHKEDSGSDVDWMANKIASLRIFQERDGKMALSVSDNSASVLVVSQFTLYGDVRRGRRPSFDDAAPPDTAEKLYEQLCRQLRSAGLEVETGRFRAKMSVHAQIDGPVTILIDSRKQF
ncbi:MAG: D-tyrosyl-tRNA(Tyr) deacylase [Deltaproteobacteria bacterium]|nr:D-tyrosyl-tRNA(Tyr) deacylase [Deltaproteobacteria bacterium]